MIWLPYISKGAPGDRYLRPHSTSSSSCPMNGGCVFPLLISTLQLVFPFHTTSRQIRLYDQRPTRLKGKLEEKPHTPHRGNNGGRYRCYISVGREWTQPLAVSFQEFGKPYLLRQLITDFKGVNFNAVLRILHSRAPRKN